MGDFHLKSFLYSLISLELSYALCSHILFYYILLFDKLKSMLSKIVYCYIKIFMCKYMQNDSACSSFLLL